MKICGKHNFVPKLKQENEAKPSVLSRLFVWWAFLVIMKGNRGPIQETDLVQPHKNYDSSQVVQSFERYWLDECQRAKKENRKPSLWKALRRAYGLYYMIPALHLIVATAARTAIPILFSRMLSYWTKEHATQQTTAVCYALIIIALLFISSLCYGHNMLFVSEISMKIQMACSALLYKKLHRTSISSLAETDASNLVTLLANDETRIFFGLYYLHYIWIAPLQVIVILYCMYNLAGFAPIVGLLIYFGFLIPLQGLLTKLTTVYRRQVAAQTDRRINFMNEIINGIQVIKMYAWEKPYQAAVQAIRTSELKAQRQSNCVRNIIMGFSFMTSQIVLSLTSLYLVLIGSPVTASKIFPIFQYLSIIEISVVLIVPLGIAQFSEMLVSLKRMQKYLLLDDREDLQITIENEIENNIVNKAKFKSTENSNRKNYMASDDTTTITDEFIIEINDVTASWPGSFESHLKNIELKVEKGKLCAIIGPVGSGKTSLLHILLKELPIIYGNLKVGGTISYASQQPWLFPTTVRENILFGSPYDVKKYMEVCKVCSLLKDFKNFPFGDQSLVGENGIILSGGQRVRVNLARAIYKEADIYLLDDPLSALDTVVGRELFESSIKTYLRGRTCLMVTHQIQFINDVDTVIILNEGMIESSGTYNELLQSGTDFSKLLSTQVNLNDEPELNTKKNIRKQSLHLSSSFKSRTENESKQQVLEKEHREEGIVKLSVICRYLKSVTSWSTIICLVIFLLLSQTVLKLFDYWLSYWTNQVALQDFENSTTEFTWETQIGPMTNKLYFLVLVGLVLICFLCFAFRTYFLIMMTYRASKTIHTNALTSVTRIAMDFFNRNPSGRILNRFSKDLDAVDEHIPLNIGYVTFAYAGIAGTLVVSVVTVPWILIPAVILVTIFAVITRFYLKAAQDAGRMESTSKSPVLGMVRSTVTGLPTIRSTNSGNTLLQLFHEAQNHNAKAVYTSIGFRMVFHMYLEFVCLIYVTVILMMFIAFDFGSTISVGSVGLVVTYSFSLMFFFKWSATVTCDLLTQFTSIERVFEYTDLPIESNIEDSLVAAKSPDDWPNKGEIEFINVYLTYGANVLPALKNINFKIESGSKIGVVGRTGAGKSSLISALFLLTDIEGCIKIDGIDTKTIARQLLRKKMSIIPQEPVLFSGTLRYNLDPFSAYSDAEIWTALEQVKLKETVSALDMKVTEGGSNFSVGQRQLICLARAVLRSNNILVMDEATANVDSMTDALIQKSIRKEFSSCTVITIAHRLNTVMDCDKILVLDNGEVVEFNHPYTLLCNPQSKLSYMANESDLREKLFDIAKEKFENDFGMTMTTQL